MTLKTLPHISFRPIQQETITWNKMSLASRQALAILAVDDIHPSEAGVILMWKSDSGSITHDQAIDEIIKRANLYANKWKPVFNLQVQFIKK